MFRGNHPTRVDEKGRLKGPRGIQARDRREVRRANSISRVWTARLLKCIPSRNGNGSSRSWHALSTYNPTKKKFLDRVNYYGQQVEMDGQGRLLMPQMLRETAQIKGEVAVMGNLTHLEVTQPRSVPKADRREPVHG